MTNKERLGLERGSASAGFAQRATVRVDADRDAALVETSGERDVPMSAHDAAAGLAEDFIEAEKAGGHESE